MHIRGPVRHELKTHPEPFEAVMAAEKMYEVRVNDRNFQVGDQLLLREWDPYRGDYTGQRLQVTVSYMTQGGTFGLPETLCVMGIIPGWRGEIRTGVSGSGFEP